MCSDLYHFSPLRQLTFIYLTEGATADLFNQFELVAQAKLESPMRHVALKVCQSYLVVLTPFIYTQGL